MHPPDPDPPPCGHHKWMAPMCLFCTAVLLEFIVYSFNQSGLFSLVCFVKAVLVLCSISCIFICDVANIDLLLIIAIIISCYKTNFLIHCMKLSPRLAKNV